MALHINQNIADIILPTPITELKRISDTSVNEKSQSIIRTVNAKIIEATRNFHSSLEFSINDLILIFLSQNNQNNQNNQNIQNEENLINHKLRNLFANPDYNDPFYCKISELFLNVSRSYRDAGYTIRYNQAAVYRDIRLAISW